MQVSYHNTKHYHMLLNTCKDSLCNVNPTEKGFFGSVAKSSNRT